MGFLLQCLLVFNRQPNTYSSDQAKVSYVNGLLKGRALIGLCWGVQVQIPTFVDFMEELKKVSNHPVCTGDVSKHILNLRHGQCG